MSETNRPDRDERQRRLTALGVSLGLCFGALAGLLLFDNIGVGIGLGIGVGLSVAAVAGRK
jgi:hypothetical protein